MRASRDRLKKVYQVLQMALSMKAISGLAYIHCLLKRIDVCKQLFVIEVELGEAAFIPPELS